MLKPDYIVRLETSGELFSDLNYLPLPKLYEFWKTKKVTKVFEKSIVDETGLYPHEVIFKTIQGFHIHLVSDKNDNWVMTIYYKIEQENELKLFTKNLIKQVKDATNNNK